MNSKKEVLVSVKNLKQYFPIRKGVFKTIQGHVKAVDDVSIDIYRGETLGVVGESGCGKTTFGKTLIQLIKETDGEVFYNTGEQMEDITKFSNKRMDEMRKKIQIVFQNPYSTLNPMFSVLGAFTDTLIKYGVKNKKDREKLVGELLDKVRLPREFMYRYPNEFSGGQRQRVGIARALSLNPELIVCDEIVSALDVSIQAQILNLMNELKQQENLTYIFISHDLSVVKYMCDRVMIMYLGRVMECTDSERLFANPTHPYTQALLTAIPSMDIDTQTTKIILEGDIPSPSNPPSGCPFRTRCKHCEDICKNERPELKNISTDEVEHLVACHFSEELLQQTLTATL